MNEANTDTTVSTCWNCSKNLKILAKELIVEAGNKKFCSYACAEARGFKIKRPKKRDYR